MEALQQLRLHIPRGVARRRTAIAGGVLLCIYLLWSDTTMLKRSSTATQEQEMAKKLALSKPYEAASTQNQSASVTPAPPSISALPEGETPTGTSPPLQLRTSANHILDHVAQGDHQATSAPVPPSGSQQSPVNPKDSDAQGFELYNLHIDHDPQKANSPKAEEKIWSSHLPTVDPKAPKTNFGLQKDSSISNPGLELYDLPDLQSSQGVGVQASQSEAAPLEYEGAGQQDSVDQQLLKDLDIAAQIDAEAMASLNSVGSASEAGSQTTADQESTDIGSESWESTWEFRRKDVPTWRRLRRQARRWIRTFTRIADIRRWYRKTWFDRFLQSVLPKTKVWAGIACFSIVSLVVAIMVAHWIVSEDGTKRHFIPGVPKDYPNVCNVVKQCCPPCPQYVVCSTCGLLKCPDDEDSHQRATE